MMAPKDYIVPADATIEDVDLEKEVVLLPDGRRLTDELAAELAQAGVAQVRRRNLVPGRKSLTGGQVHSPLVSFRLPADLRDRAARAAEKEGVSVSLLGRKALEKYLAERR